MNHSRSSQKNRCPKPGLRRTALLLFSALILLWLACPGKAYSYIIINAPMTDANAAGWVLGGNPYSAQLTGNGAIDPVGSGWLRITNNSGNQTGFAYNTTTFDLSAGLLIQFDYAAWGGNGADGISVFLFDAGVSPFNVGAFGGSLGYAQKLPPAVPSAVPGVSGGYVGIGVDEFGNYSNPSEGRYLGPGFYPNTLAVRGSVNGFGNGAIGGTADTTSYPWIATSSNSGSLWINSATRPDQLSSNYRKVIVQITPAPNPTVSAWVQFGYNTSPTPMFSNQPLPAISSSQQLMVGFGGSTGGSNNYHEIRNLLITSLNTNTAVDLGITKTPVATGTTTPALTSATVGTSFQYLIAARNYGPNNITATGVGITDTFPANIIPGAWTCTANGGATCGATSGSGNLNTTANLPRYGAVTYRVNATLNSSPPGNSVSNTASLTIPGSVIDYNSGNDSATSTLNSYTPPTVTKTFTPAAILPGGTSTLTITMTNPNNVAATGVTLTDTYPTTPGAMVNAGSPNRTNTCGGSSSGTRRGTNVRLTGSGNSIPANGSCSISIDVTAPTAGVYTNSTGPVATTNIGAGTASTATLTVLAPPTVAKSFADGSIASGDNTNMTVTIGNPNASAITLTSALTDTFPAGMTVNGTAGNTGTCTGVTATAGDNKFTMASGTSIPPGGCTVIVNVAATATGTNTIAAGALQTSAGNNAGAASATLTTYNHANLTKVYSAPTIATGTASTLTFTITNGTNNPAQSNLGFTDTFPAGLVVTGVSTVSGAGCSGTTAFTPSTVTLTNGAITSGRTTCTLTATVQGNTEGTYVNGSAQFSGQSGGLDASGANATLNVYTPPTLTKSFSPTSIAVGGTSVLTLALANPATNPGNLSTVRVDDTFPTGMTLKNTTFTFTPAGCGTVTKTTGGASAAGDNTIRFTDTAQTPGASCQVQMNVTISTATDFTNTTNAPTASGPISLTGTAATATLNGTQAPTVTKSFASTNMAGGGNTNLTVSISNTNASAITLTGDLTDTFPAGMTIGAAGNTGTCPGVTANAGAGSFTMASGSSIPTGGCTIIVNVTSSTPGAATNTIAAGALQTSVGGNAAAASATLNVFAPPTLTKSFAPSTISYGGSTVLTLALGNPSANVAAITSAQVDDNFPSGLTLQNTTFTFTPAACGAVTKTSGAASAAGDNNIRFSAATIAPGATCQVAVNVVSSAAANVTNSTNAPTAAGPVPLSGTVASAILTVAPVLPTITKSFAAGSIAGGGNTNLTVTVGNTNSGAIPLTSALTDSFPAGMTIGAAGNSGTCPGVTANTGATSFTMASGSVIPVGGCTVIVNVTSSTVGAAVNTIAAGALQTVAGSNAAAASATLNVFAPPTVTKSFGASSIGAGGGTTLTLTLGNPSVNMAAITTVAVDDTFPTGLTLQNTAFTFTPAACGAVTKISGAASSVGDNNIRFIAPSIDPGATCQVVVNVKSSTTGSVTNTTGAPTATGPAALTGVAASAPLTVTLLSAPTVVKTFNPTQIGTGVSSLVTVTLTNPNGIDITGVAFIDTLPTTPGQMTTTSVLTNSCGGTGTITGSKSFSLTGGTIPANGSCYLSVSVTATALGTYTNTTTTITSANATTAPAASAQLTVALLGAPLVAKTFSPNQIGGNGTSVMTVTLTNPNPVAITGAAFTDNYPSGLVNTATPNGVINGAGCSGTVTAAANGASLALANGTIPASGSCTVTVAVTSASSGTYVNSTGPVATANASTGTAASGTLNVLRSPAVTKSFAPTPILPNGASVMTVTLTNPNNFTITGAAFTDSYPSGLVNTATPSGAISGTGCSGTVTAAANGAALALSNGTIPANGSCSVSVNVTSASNGSYVNSTGQITTTNAGTTAAVTGTLNVGQPTVQVTKTSNNGTGTFAFAGTNGVAASFNITTATAGTPAAGPVYTVTSVSSAVTVTETAPAGWPTNPVSATCSDTNGAVSGNGAGTFGSLSANVLTIPTANLKPAARIVCAFVNTATSSITVTKVLAPTGDPGVFNLLVGSTTVASGVGNGGSGTVTVPAGAAVTVSETAAGSTSLSDYTATYSCTGGITGAGSSVSITPAPGQAVTCTFTNTRNGVNVSGAVYGDANHDGAMDGGEAGTGQTLYVKLSSYNGSSCAGSATAFVAANPATGVFSFPTVTAGNYCLTLSTNSNLADPLATFPAGWLPLETPTGIRTVTVTTTPLAGLNFGLYNGSRLSGRVFSDTGAGGGIPNDGVQQGGEAGLSGVAVKVTNSGGGTVYDSTTTGGNGDYTLWIPAAAGNNQLKVVETNPGGSISTGGSGGSYDRTTDSITFTNSVGAVFSGFTFADVPVNTFVSNSSKSVVAGGTVYHPHTFTAGTGGQVTFTTSATASPAIAGWSELLYLDSNCSGTLDLGEPQITAPITTTAGQQVCILVKEFAPGNAPVGASDTVTVTASFAYSNSNPPLPAGVLTVTDLTTVMQAGLTLLKSVDKSSAKPGDTLTYTITYVNTGSTPLTDVVINDNVPTFTSLVSPLSSSACCVGTSPCLGSPTTPYPAAITGCTVITAPSAVTWMLTGSLNPGSSGQVKFIVTIDN